MSSPTIQAETFYDGPQGGPDGPTPVDAKALNDIWDAIERVLLYQLTPRLSPGDTTVSMGEMVLVDTNGGDRHVTAPVASTPGSWGVRNIGAHQVVITTVAADVLDETNTHTWTLRGPADEAVFSYVAPGRFTMSRQNAFSPPASATGYGLVQLGAGGDLVGPANAITVPGKENVGVAAGLVNAHRSAQDPHGDRQWASGQFVPLSWFDGNGALLPSHTGALSIISTNVVSSQSGMLSLNAQQGDIAIRTDAASTGGQRTYILQGSDPTVLANWTVMPALGAVSSVRGAASGSIAQTGDVVLSAADLGAETLANKGAPNGYAGLLANGTVSTANLPGASTTAYGLIRLQGDLAGTYAAPTVPALATKAPLFTPNPTIYTTASNPHTPVQGEIAQYNASAASIVQALPAAPTGTAITVLELKNLTPAASSNTVQFNAAGTDTIDYVASNPLVLRLYGETRRLIGYQGNWTVSAGLNTLTGLDTRYLKITDNHPVPAGGTSAQILAKTGAADYATAWVNPPVGLPAGGANTQILAKSAVTDYAVGWVNIPVGIPAGGAANYVLGKTSAADYAVGWVAQTGGASSPIENVNTVAASGTTQTLPDVTTATIHDVTLTGNCTFTFPTAAAGKSFTLILRQDATGSRTTTWPTVLWPSATAPILTTTASRVDILTFVAIQTGASTFGWSGTMAAKDVR